MSSYLGRRSNPGALLGDGAALLQRFDAERHAPVAPWVERLKQAHTPFVAAEQRLRAAVAAEAAASERLADADAARDAALRELDAQLIAAGGSKTNSLEAYGCASSPSRLVELASAQATKVCRKLVLAVLAKHQGGAPAVVRAAKALDQRNAAVSRAAELLAAKAQASAQARVARNAYRHPLRAAVARLKLAARTAEADGAPGLLQDLFAVAPTRARGKKARAARPGDGG